MRKTADVSKPTVRAQLKACKSELEYARTRLARLERQLEARDHFGQAFLRLVKVELER